MSSIYRKVKAVEAVFKQLAQDADRFQQHSKLTCLTGCSHCCSNPNIEASVLEFLPFAYYAYKQGLALSWLEKLKSDQAPSLCAILRPFHKLEERGFCSQYAYRGLVCRLFGFSAVRNKYGSTVLATCRPIKEHQQENVALAQQQIGKGAFVPVGNHYYMQLTSIDFILSNAFYPINEAIAKALEEVLNYYTYRGKPRLKKAS